MSRELIKLLFTSVEFAGSGKLTWVLFSPRLSASWGRFSLHRPHFATVAAPLRASPSSCSSWAPQIFRETGQHCWSWKRTEGPTQSYAHSSRVCGHDAKHFREFSKINVLTLIISNTFVTFFIAILLIACYIRAAKKSNDKHTKNSQIDFFKIYFNNNR